MLIHSPVRADTHGPGGIGLSSGQRGAVQVQTTSTGRSRALIEWPDTFQPVVVAVLGAPGSGKSTVRPLLAERLASRVVLDWDDFMDAASRLADVDIRQAPVTWESYRELVRSVIEAVAPVPVVLFTVCTPGRVGGMAHQSMAAARLLRPGPASAPCDPTGRLTSPTLSARPPRIGDSVWSPSTARP